jgi:hypothetical protein
MTVTTPVPSGFTQLISPYMGSFQVMADFAAGDEAAALSNIRQEWGSMISRDPGGVEWERVRLDGKLAPGAIADSAAHAWSTGPTAALSQYVLGVNPVRAGYARWIAAPEPAQLSWAQGVAPTPHGPISVRWERGLGSRSFKLTVVAPRDTDGAVQVPLLGRRRTIAMDGRIVWDGRHDRGGANASAAAGTVVFNRVRGRHTFAWAQP